MREFDELFAEDKKYYSLTEEQQKSHNKDLFERYPFLEVKMSMYRGWKYDPASPKRYKTSWLDDMPEGWRKSFGLLFCEDLRDALLAGNMLNEYTIVQVKEKYGELRWYDNGATKEVENLIEDYSVISQYVCVRCGKLPVPTTSYGWIEPICSNCYSKELGNNENWKEKMLSEHNEGYKNLEMPKTVKGETYSNGERMPYERNIEDKVNKIISYLMP